MANLQVTKISFENRKNINKVTLEELEEINLD